MKASQRSILAARLTPVLLSAALAGCQSKLPETVRIGVAVPLSGPTANRGQDLLNGAQLAAEELNASGFRIQGRPVKFEIVAKDDKADTETVKKVAQELCNEKVHAVIGHLNSPNTATAVPIYGAHGVPVLTTSTQMSIPAKGSGNVFRLVANDRVQSRALAGFAVERLHARRIAVLVESTDYGKEMLADMSGALKEKKQDVALQMDVDFKTAVTDEMVAKIKDAKADVVIVIGREIHGISLLNKLNAAQYVTPAVLVTNAIKTPKVAGMDAMVSGVFATATVVEATELPAGREFLERFKTKYKAEPVWGAHYAYDAVYTMADMIRRAGSAEPKDLMAKLKTAEPNTRVIHQMRFAATGEQSHPAIGVYKAERAQWVPQVRTAAW